MRGVPQGIRQAAQEEANVSDSREEREEKHRALDRFDSLLSAMEWAQEEENVHGDNCEEENHCVVCRDMHVKVKAAREAVLAAYWREL
jgi:hypothetical protein